LSYSLRVRLEETSVQYFELALLGTLIALITVLSSIYVIAME
jgi:hypothetical protein